MGNRKGFIGVSANTYFTKVHDTIQSAENALGTGQDMIRETSNVENQNENYIKRAQRNDPTLSQIDDSLHTMDEFVPGSYVNQYEKNIDKLYASLSSSAVTTDDDLYDYVSDKNIKCDEQMADKLLYAISAMENVLNEHLQVPTATPKVEAILEEVKKSLSESSRLSNVQSKEISEYKRDIVIIDEKVR